jgi:hypothetical protein
MTFAFLGEYANMLLMSAFLLYYSWEAGYL